LYKNKKISAIILARYGSKRLKDKNVLNFYGKPLYYWTLLAAKKSKYIDNIILSTDDKRIINHTKKIRYVKTYNRPKKLRGDKITSENVILNIIKKKNFPHDFIIILQPTSPLRKSNDIDKAVKSLIDKNENFLVSACYRTKSYKNMIEIKKGFFQRFKKKKSGYSFNGAIYMAKTSYFKKTKTFFTKKTIIFPMSKSKSVDIDSKEDFQLAIKKFKNVK